MNLMRLFRRSNDATKHPSAHMTWSSSLGQRVSRTGVFLKKQLWVWPIVAVVLLSVVGFSVQRAIESTIKQNLGSGLQTLLTVEIAMLEAWFEVQQSNAESHAKDGRFRELVYQLLAAQEEKTSDDESTQLTVAHRDLHKELEPLMSSHDYEGFHIISKSERILSSSYPALIGQVEVPEYDSFLARVFDGETVVCPPFPSVVMMQNEEGKLRAGQPSMYVCTPVRDSNFQVVAALALQIRPEREFTRILQLGQFGDSGES